MDDERRMEIGFDGPTADTVESGRLFGFAHDYVGAVESIIGDKRMKDVTLRGVREVPGRAAVAVFVTDDVQVKEAADELRVSIGPEHKSKRVRKLYQDLVELPVEYRPRVALPRIQWSTPVRPRAAPRPPAIATLTTRRVEIERAGGKNPRVRVIDLVTGHRFTLDATRDDAARAGRMLYAKADIRVELLMHRETFEILGGQLLALTPVAAQATTIEEMKEWWRGRYAGRSS